MEPRLYGTILYKTLIEKIIRENGLRSFVGWDHRRRAYGGGSRHC